MQMIKIKQIYLLMNYSLEWNHKNREILMTNKIELKRCMFFTLVLTLLLTIMPYSAIYAACCTAHGGVTTCNSKTGYQMCKDGTQSPSCRCTPEKAAAAVSKGCCSGHGGVARCNTQKGYQQCGDGTLSPSCACH